MALPGLSRSERRSFVYGKQRLDLADCLDWLQTAEAHSIAAVVTDPPYGFVEYSEVHQRKLRAGRGGVWRIPPSFDGYNRQPLPRFTVLSALERQAIRDFFETWAEALLPVLLPGAHVIIAGNPLVSPLVAAGMEAAGFERRGEIVRLVRTFRGGDRPKAADKEFPDLSTMPRANWEPWGLYRKPLSERTLAANLRKWGVGALRRPARDSPFADVIPSGVTPRPERKLAPHPSVKPQAFMRQIVRAMIPTEGIVLDTFAGCATTLAAAEALGVQGVGVELDPDYFDLATKSIPALAAL
jgi:DNA modification methylase